MLRRTVATFAVTAAFSAVAAPALACPPPAGGNVNDRLTITYQEDEGAEEKKYVLECHPAGGTHPKAQEACDAVDKASRGIKNPWEPVARDAACTQIYGGPQTARVTGTWQGRTVEADFKRTNGCEIARWDTLVPALPEVK